MPPKHFRNPHGSNAGDRIRPKESLAGSTDTSTPVFCFHHLVPGWGVEECASADQAALVVHLCRLSKLTWQAIKNAPRHGLGTETIDRTAIRAPVPTGITDDVRFLALRFSGLKAMVGYRSGAVFHILWLDPAFRLYRH